MKTPLLTYLGKQEDGRGGYIRLWNIYNSPMIELHPNGSSISLESLKEMGVITR